MSGTFTSTQWSQALGVVVVSVTGMAAGQRVARLRSNGKVYLLHQVDQPSGPTSLTDWQPPLGETATYLILASAESPPQQALDRTTIRVAGGMAYLRRLNDPLLVSTIRVVSTGTEGEEARSTTFDISGRRAPLVVFNSRSARRGTITLLTDTRDERNSIEFIVSDGSPLLFNMCASKAFQPLQAVVGDVRWTRVRSMATRFQVELDYMEVEDGDWIGDDLDFVPPVFQANIYSDIQNLTYQQVLDLYQRYIGLATGTPA